MAVPRSIASAWRWVESIHTAHWLAAAVVESTAAGALVTWVARAWNQIPLSLAIVYGLFGTACALLIAVAIKQFLQPLIPESKSDQPIQAQKKIKEEGDSFQKELAKRAIENRQQLFRGATAKPRYSPPSDAKDLDITTLKYKELGKLMEATGNEVLKFHRTIPYNASDETVISQFHKKIAPGVLWVYEEAKKRGHHDSTIDSFYFNPQKLRPSGIEWLGKSLITLGAGLTLYIDS